MTAGIHEGFYRLDDEAKAVCAAWFGMMIPGVGTLTFGMKERRPSKRAQAALDRLAAEGIIRRDDAADGSMTYVPQADCCFLLEWFVKVSGDPRFRFPLTEKISPTAKDGFTMSLDVPRGLDAGRRDLET